MTWTPEQDALLRARIDAGDTMRQAAAAVRFFDGLKANARRLHAPTKHIDRAQQEWLHRALRGGDVA